MKILIDIDGNLHLEKRGRMKLQWCPHSFGLHQNECGERCPLFEVSKETKNLLSDGSYGDPYRCIDFCQGKTITVSSKDYSEELK